MTFNCKQEYNLLVCQITGVFVVPVCGSTSEGGGGGGGEGGRGGGVLVVALLCKKFL